MAQKKITNAVNFLNMKAKDYNFDIKYHDITDHSRNLFNIYNQDLESDVV